MYAGGRANSRRENKDANLVQGKERKKEKHLSKLKSKWPYMWRACGTGIWEIHGLTETDPPEDACHLFSQSLLSGVDYQPRLGNTDAILSRWNSG